MNDRQRILEQLRQQSLRARAQALNEQARNRQSLTPIVPSSGDGGCNPASGIGMYLTLDFGEGSPLGILKSLIRMEYQGVDEGGKPMYAATLIPEVFSATLNYNYSVSKWKFTINADVPVVYHSDSLIGSNWTTDTPDSTLVGLLSECGYRELPVYCIDAGELGLIQPLPTWREDQSVAETPPIWNGFGVIAIWLPALGGPDGWLFGGEGLGEALVPGGSVNELPLGEIPFIGGGSVTVSAGACDF